MNKITARRAVNRLICTAIDLGLLPDDLDPDGDFGPLLAQALEQAKSKEYAASNIYKYMVREIELTICLYDGSIQVPTDDLGRYKWGAEINGWLTRLKKRAEIEKAQLKAAAKRQEHVARGGMPKKKKKRDR